MKGLNSSERHIKLEGLVDTTAPLKYDPFFQMQQQSSEEQTFIGMGKQTKIFQQMEERKNGKH